MFTGIIGDLVSDIFRKAVRTILTLTFVGICVLGAGFATGMIHPSDLSPAHVRQVIGSFQDRVNVLKGFTGQALDNDPTGVIDDLRDNAQDLRGIGASDNPYGTDDRRSETDDPDDNATLAGNY